MIETQAKVKPRISQRYLALLTEKRQRRLKEMKTQLIENQANPSVGQKIEILCGQNCLMLFLYCDFYDSDKQFIPHNL